MAAGWECKWMAGCKKLHKISSGSSFPRFKNTLSGINGTAPEGQWPPCLANLMLDLLSVVNFLLLCCWYCAIHFIWIKWCVISSGTRLHLCCCFGRNPSPKVKPPAETFPALWMLMDFSGHRVLLTFLSSSQSLSSPCLITVLMRPLWHWRLISHQFLF